MSVNENTPNTTPDDSPKAWSLLRVQIMFWCGLIGFFLYLGLVEILRKPFHLEFLLGFLAMMGIGIAQSLDRRDNGKS